MAGRSDRSEADVRRDAPVPVARELLFGVRRLPARRWPRRKRYELRFRDGGAASCDRTRLDTMLDARRWPADFWAVLAEVDRTFDGGDDGTIIDWPTGQALQGDHSEVGTETLRHRKGRIESSRGYRVRATGRAGSDYSDSDGDLHIDSEMMATPAVVIYAESIPDHRSRVLERVMRAWLWAGLDVDVYPPRSLPDDNR